MRKNIKPKAAPLFTHEGAKAVRITPYAELRRSVLACLLFEDEFYEDGVSIAKRITTHAMACDPVDVAMLAIEARKLHNLRHVPLLLLDALTVTGAGIPELVRNTISHVVSRADELSELLAVYMRNGRKPLSGQLKKGLAKAFRKFDEYQLAKYNREGKYTLRDVLFLCHAKPENEAQQKLWERLINDELKVPDTWEVALSGGADKKETFERLIREGKLGYFALLRNLRTMEQAGVDRNLVNEAIVARKNGADKVLPFRFIAAARAAVNYEPALDIALCENIKAMPMLKGHTGVLVDVSSSMNDKLSRKSDLTRMDAAAALASVINAEQLTVCTFSNMLVHVPARKGMAGVDAIIRSQPHCNTRLGAALTEMLNRFPTMNRLIVITDEQSHDNVRMIANTGMHMYMINVASNKNGVGYGGGWRHVDGFSENVIKYIMAVEAEDAIL